MSIPPNQLDHFSPGEPWYDDRGNLINAHGAGFLHHDGMYYWYGEHKIEGTGGNRAHVGVHAYSSGDLYNWHDEGIALAVSENPSSEIARGCVLERPKVVFNAKTGQFVMWFHLEPAGTENYSGARSGVAVSSTPVGPFAFLDSFRPNAGVWPQNTPAEYKRPLDAVEQARVASLELPGGPVPYFPKNLLFRRDFENGCTRS